MDYGRKVKLVDRSIVENELFLLESEHGFHKHLLARNRRIWLLVRGIQFEDQGLQQDT
jgi:hypothetical protein